VPAASLLPVDDAKDAMDQFFSTLDGTDGSNPNYFVVSIVANTGASIQALQAARDADDIAAAVTKLVSTDRADRLVHLADLVGNGSLSMDIGAADFTPILEAIGNSIIAKEGTFKIARAPTSVEEMIVRVVHTDGSYTSLPTSKFSVDGTARTLTITDLNTILSFAAGDRILINYEPKTVF